MIPVPQTNKKSDTGLLTIKEASAKLDLSESTVKKYIKDFDLETQKGPQNKPFLSEDTFQALTEIAKLRANGLSIQEIKELKSQEPLKNVLDEVEETQSKKSEAPLIQEAIIDASDLKEEKPLSEEIVSDEIEVVPEKEGELLPEETEITEDGENGEHGERRRRLFNYRYVERQISGDSKRVSSLRQRLRNPNLSVRDRLFFEESLERRILFLNGWKHILRWVSTK